MEGRSFLRTFDIKRHIKRYIKMPCMRASLYMGAPLVNLEVIRWPGLFFLENWKIYLDFFLGPRGYYDFKSGGHLELW